MTLDFALDTINGLVKAIEVEKAVEGGGNPNVTMKAFFSGSIYCGRCKGMRRVRITTQSLFSLFSDARFDGPVLRVSYLCASLPSVFLYRCTQCDAIWSVLVYPTDQGARMALLPGQFASDGIASSHTPLAVAFYLDQAAKSHHIGANSAAIAMFRSALECLLEDQGFTQRMVGPKLQALRESIDRGTAPAWAREIEPDYLEVIKKLGDISVHANAGELKKQDLLDAQLYRQVEISFLEVIEVIYEKPARQRDRLAKLKEAATSTIQPKEK